MRTRRLLLALAIASTLGAIGPAQALEWPQRTVKIIAPFPAGGLSDGLARLIAQRLSETLGQQFIVENRPGAAGAIGAEAVARSPADGYTLLLASPSQIAIVPAMTKTRYDPVKDLAPVGMISTSATALVVNPGFPAKSLAEFIAHVRAQPHKLSYASGGVGTHNNLGMVLLLKRAGLDMVHVTYKGGVQAMSDVVAGHVPVMLANLADALPQAASGAIRIIAVTSERRARLVPDVPTHQRVRLSGLQDRHLERADGAHRHAARDHRSDRRGACPRGQGSEARRADCEHERRPAGQRTGGVCRHHCRRYPGLGRSGQPGRAQGIARSAAVPRAPPIPYL